MDKQAQKNVFSIFFLSILLLVTISGAFTYLFLQRLLDTNQVVVNIEETTRAANQALLTLTEAEAEVNNYLLSRNPHVIENFSYYLISSDMSIKALSQLIEDNPQQAALLSKLKPLLSTKIERMNQIIDNVKNNNIQDANKIATSMDRSQLNKDIKILVNRINQNESRYLSTQTFIFENKVNDINTLYIALFTVLIAIGLIGYRILNNYV